MDEDVEVLKSLNKNDLIEFYNTYIDLESPKRSKASVQMTASGVSPDKRTAFLKTLGESLTSSINLSVEPTALAPTFESVDINNSAAVAAALRGFLEKEHKVESAKIDTAVAEASKVNVAATDGFRPEDFGHVLENVVEWKANCMVSAGARPVRPLVEYEENESKL